MQLIHIFAFLISLQHWHAVCTWCALYSGNDCTVYLRHNQPMKCCILQMYTALWKSLMRDSSLPYITDIFSPTERQQVILWVFKLCFLQGPTGGQGVPGEVGEPGPMVRPDECITTHASLETLPSSIFFCSICSTIAITFINGIRKVWGDTEHYFSSSEWQGCRPQCIRLSQH